MAQPRELLLKTVNLELWREVDGISACRGKIRRDAEGIPDCEGDSTGTLTDAETRKRGEQTGLDTPGSPRPKRCTLVVVRLDPLRVMQLNTLSVPPGEYGRKTKTQRN